VGGGGQDSIPAYASTAGPSPSPEKVAERATIIASRVSWVPSGSFGASWLMAWKANDLPSRGWGIAHTRPSQVDMALTSTTQRSNPKRLAYSGSLIAEKLWCRGAAPAVAMGSQLVIACVLKTFSV